MVANLGVIVWGGQYPFLYQQLVSTTCAHGLPAFMCRSMMLAGSSIPHVFALGYVRTGLQKHLRLLAGHPVASASPHVCLWLPARAGMLGGGGVLGMEYTSLRSLAVTGYTLVYLPVYMALAGLIGLIVMPIGFWLSLRVCTRW